MKKPLFQSISIVGVGLMGGSIGLAVKKRKTAGLVVGVSRHKQTIQKVFEKKAADVMTLDLIEGIKNADLVVLCSPVSVIAKQIKMIAPYLKKGAIVMDVGSSKAHIEKEAKKYLKKNIFVGCHPMAGSECAGVENASADLFEGSVCFVTKANPKVTQFWKALGSFPVVLDAKKHDAWVAKASHLPHLLTFAFFQDFKALNVPMNPSLRGLARLAKSNPELWSDIFLSNRGSILHSMKTFENNFSQFKKALSSSNSASLKKLITNANRHSPHHG